MYFCILDAGRSAKLSRLAGLTTFRGQPRRYILDNFRCRVALRVLELPMAALVAGKFAAEPQNVALVAVGRPLFIAWKPDSRRIVQVRKSTVFIFTNLLKKPEMKKPKGKSRSSRAAECGAGGRWPAAVDRLEARRATHRAGLQNC